MIWFFTALTAVVVVVIALVAVGRVTFSLAEIPRQSSYELQAAVEFVADNLPGEVTAQISYEDVQEVLELHLDYLEAKGVAVEEVPAPGAAVRTDGRRAAGARAGGLVTGEGRPGRTGQPGGAEDPAPKRLPGEYRFPEWPEAAGAGPLVADDDEALAYILGRLGQSGSDIEDVHVVRVLEAERGYLEAIGAIGTSVADPTKPAPADGPERSSYP